MDEIKRLVTAGEMDRVAEILGSKRRLRLEQPIRMGRPLLHIASRRGRLDIVQLIAQRPDFDVDMRDQCNANTALHHAAKTGKRSVVNFLLKKGAKPNVADSDGYTALHFALMGKFTDIVRDLLALDTIRLDVVDKKGRTVLHRAVETGDTDLVRMLIFAERKDQVAPKLDLDAQDSGGQTALHYASFNSFREICELLCKQGASTSLVDKQGHKGLFWGLGFFSGPRNPHAEFHYCGDPRCNHLGCSNASKKGDDGDDHHEHGRGGLGRL